MTKGKLKPCSFRVEEDQLEAFKDLVYLIEGDDSLSPIFRKFITDYIKKHEKTLQKDADKFALNALIPEELWDQCLSRFALSEEAVRIDADNLGINSSIIAGRIRKERSNYTILNGLVGQGQVRPQFEETVDDLD